MESFKNTRYFQLLHNGEEVNSEELEVAFQDFTHEIYQFCLNERDKNLLYFTLQYARTFLITLQATRESNSLLPTKGAIAFIEAALNWINTASYSLPAEEETAGQEATEQEEPVERKIVWTGKIIHFVEWIYGPDSLKHFNDGNVTIRELVEYLGKALGIEVKSPGGCYVDMRDRLDESRTTYIDSMREALSARMEKDDEKKYRRNK